MDGDHGRESEKAVGDRWGRGVAQRAHPGFVIAPYRTWPSLGTGWPPTTASAQSDFSRHAEDDCIMEVSVPFTATFQRLKGPSGDYRGPGCGD